jgi:hypothetical protein
MNWVEPSSSGLTRLARMCILSSMAKSGSWTASVSWLLAAANGMLNHSLCFLAIRGFWGFADAMSLVYAAKKRAEVAPGVGTETDLVIVTTRPPNIIHAYGDSDIVQGLERVYQEHKKKLDDDFASQHRAVDTFLKDLFAKAAAEAKTRADAEAAQPTGQSESRTPPDVSPAPSDDAPPLALPPMPSVGLRRKRKASAGRLEHFRFLCSEAVAAMPHVICTFVGHEEA